MDTDKIKRKNTRQIRVGNVLVGGGARVTVQTMTSCSVTDVAATIGQIKRVALAGCNLVRVAVNNERDIISFGKVVRSSSIPVIADIQFIPGLAVMAIKAGAHCVRVNPGYLRETRELKDIISAAIEYGAALRVGANSGSLPRHLSKSKMSISQKMVISVKEISEVLLSYGFDQFKASLKASSVIQTVEAYRVASEVLECPLHLGVTEAGPLFPGLIKSSIGIGSLLLEGIGDTIRVSLTADPVQEVIAGRGILRATGLLDEGLDIISCPTCGRCEVDLMSLAQEFYEKTINIKKSLKVAIMGCPVNGPGEAKEADIGVAFAKDFALIFNKGIKKKKVSFDEAFDALMNEIQVFGEEGSKR